MSIIYWLMRNSQKKNSKHSLRGCPEVTHHATTANAPDYEHGLRLKHGLDFHRFQSNGNAKYETKSAVNTTTIHSRIQPINETVSKT